MKNKLYVTIVAAALCVIPGILLGQSGPILPAASGFVLFTSNGNVTNSGTSYITGNAGSNSGTTSGFGNINGQIHDQDAVSQQVKTDLDSAWGILNAVSCNSTLAAGLGGGQTLTGNQVYCVNSAATLSGDLLLNAAGDADQVFVLKINGGLTLSPNARVLLINGARSCRVFWKVDGPVSIGSNATLAGTIISSGNISTSAGSVIDGRLLTRSGTVSVVGTNATVPIGTGCGIQKPRGPLAPYLNIAMCYSVYSGNGSVANTGITTVVGDIGTNNGAVIGYDTMRVTGGLHYKPDSSTAQVAIDLNNTYNYLNGLPYDIDLASPAQLGNKLVLTPHVYRLNGPTVLSDTLILDGLGNPSATFVFQVSSTFSASANAKVILRNGARASNVFWKIEGATTSGVNTLLAGTILVHNGTLSLGAGTIVDGRAFTMSGTLSTTSATIFLPSGNGPCGSAITNNAPNANDDTLYTTPKNTPITIDVTANDDDINEDTLTVSIITPPSHGTVVVNPGGTVTYIPNPGFVGKDTFYYRICDNGTPPLCDSAKVIITVGPNRPPVAVDDNIGVLKNTPITIDVLANDYDPDGDPLTLSTLTQPQHGTIVVTGNKILYTPTLNYLGPDSFQYKICDNGPPVYCDSAWVYTNTVTNRAPDAVNDTATTIKNVPVVINITANDIEPDGDSITIAIITHSLHGTDTLIGRNARYTPALNYLGPDSFQYRICDNGSPSLCDSAWVFINTVTNRAPIAVNDSVTTPRNTPVLVNVTGNDSDPDGNPLALSITIIPKHGTVSIVGNNVRYIPSTNFLGVDSFQYMICDNGSPSLCATAWVYVNVILLQGNRQPVALNDVVSICQNSGTTLINVQSNDSDPDFDQLNTGILFGPDHGTATVNANNVLYTPASGYSGRDTILYFVCDNGTPSLCATAAIYIQVNAAPAPLAGSDIEVCHGSSIAVGKSPVSGNTYLWSPVTGLSSPTIANPTAKPDTTTTYTFTETNTATGCATPNIVKIIVNPRPAAFTGPHQNVYLGAGVVLGGPAVARNRYAWTPAAGLSASNISQPTARPTSTTTYTLVETDTVTACSNQNSVTVSVFAIEFFNGFSPNGDGKNDFWKIPILDVYPDNSVVILNRWGAEVWSTKGYNNTNNYWSGKNMNGDDLPDGSYYYTITYGNEVKTGWVIIKR